eukprot:2022867-Prymnesium_polylepis.1
MRPGCLGLYVQASRPRQLPQLVNHELGQTATEDGHTKLLVGLLMWKCANALGSFRGQGNVAEEL